MADGRNPFTSHIFFVQQKARLLYDLATSDFVI